MFLEKQYQLGDEVTAAFTIVIDGILTSTLKEILLSHPDLQEKAKGCISPQELVKLLPLECFMPCLKRVRKVRRELAQPAELCKQNLPGNRRQAWGRQEAIFQSQRILVAF